MRQWISILLILLSLGLAACAPEPAVETPVGEAPAEAPAEQPEKTEVKLITPEDAKARMDAGEEIILIDVRTKEEYDQERIPGAILLPVDQVQKNAAEVMPDLDATYFVYCRSGNRSSIATALLASMGYKNIYDLGGIIDWPYETVSLGD
ncbi:rhodanese-like domain-containing protein [Acidaminobacter hydrogenoformans]|uniref:Rhodanese-related sulfurtransferase n=1 Tax=Acidaminobacter hydrogenoformans DSM 2784 TaxID=1120920 RepID=A0A1G5S0Z0_9FIRM|nr:rhodanese-like domain-containing protein [Acidaminobacter hydrogenoformans]SCZ79797.1 Rhodanese-related sulfurtransferase [Acidaminobacter hydrogenoformans DSM 2784]